MTIGLIGRKCGMTRVFTDAGESIPVTVIEAGPCTVTEVRTAERDGYQAIQLGFGTNRESRFTRPVLGQFKKRNLPPSRVVKEFRVGDTAGFEIGGTLTVTMFAKAETSTCAASPRAADSRAWSSGTSSSPAMPRTARLTASSPARSALRRIRRAW
jgi:50S ribosomal protein uL3